MSSSLPAALTALLLLTACVTTAGPARPPETLSVAPAAAATREKFDSADPADFADLLAGKGGQVHHAIERQVLDRYPGVFSITELNQLKNMRGIPGEFSTERYQQRAKTLQAELRKRGLQPGTPEYNKHVRQFHAKVREEDLRKKQLHNSKIREMWDRHYCQLNEQLRKRGLKPGMPGYDDFVRKYLGTARDEIDWAMGQFFSEYRSGLDWTPSAGGQEAEAARWPAPVAGPVW